MVTRRSEGGNDCGMGGHYSTQHLAPRRQHSQTHSEPDNSAVDAGSVHNSTTGKFFFFNKNQIHIQIAK